MERLNLLSIALGLACLAGVNLYLTVFVTGLAINQHWIVLSPAYQSLEVLGQPWIVFVAGTFYFLEFFADKVPWLDSAWDAVHTVIRPIGGALLAVRVLGHSSPTMDIILVLLAGGTSLVTHTAKASTRLVANSSPEPFSNVALSVAEDVGVFSGLALLHYNPVLAFSIFVIGLGVFLYFAPKILRAVKAKIWLAFSKLNGPADLHRDSALPISLPSRLATVFSRQNVLGETIAWAIPCLSGRCRKIPANLFGALIATNEEPNKLVFVAKKRGRDFSQTIDLEGATVAHEPQFLSENLVVFPQAGQGPRFSFMFARSRRAFVERMVEYLRERAITPSAGATKTLAPEPVAHV